MIIQPVIMILISVSRIKLILILPALRLILAIRKLKTEKLLLNILPAEVANRLKSGDDIIADNHKSVSVLFSHLVGFTTFSKNIEPRDLVILLNKIFTEFDEAVKELKMEKIKTIGDAYMAVSGLPKQNRNHAYNAVLLGNEMLIRLHKIRKKTGLNFKMRVGIHSGPVTAGIIGKNKFIYGFTNLR